MTEWTEANADGSTELSQQADHDAWPAAKRASLTVQREIEIEITPEMISAFVLAMEGEVPDVIWRNTKYAQRGPAHYGVPHYRVLMGLKAALAAVTAHE